MSPSLDILLLAVMMPSMIQSKPRIDFVRKCWTTGFRVRDYTRLRLTIMDSLRFSFPFLFLRNLVYSLTRNGVNTFLFWKLTRRACSIKKLITSNFVFSPRNRSEPQRISVPCWLPKWQRNSVHRQGVLQGAAEVGRLQCSAHNDSPGMVRCMHNRRLTQSWDSPFVSQGISG